MRRDQTLQTCYKARCTYPHTPRTQLHVGISNTGVMHCFIIYVLSFKPPWGPEFRHSAKGNTYSFRLVELARLKASDPDQIVAFSITKMNFLYYKSLYDFLSFPDNALWASSQYVRSFLVFSLWWFKSIPLFGCFTICPVNLLSLIIHVGFNF